MASIMTNASALTALQSLNATNKTLEITQSRISTGYRVADASDNAAYWSIATTMRSDFKALSTVQDSLGLGASKVDTAYTGMNKAIETVNEIKVKLVAANGASAADKEKIRHRNQGAAGPAEELCRRRDLLGRQLAVDRHHDRPRRCRHVRRRQDRRVVQPQRGRHGLARHHRHQGPGHQALRRLRQRHGTNDGILDADRLGASGARAGALRGSAAVAGTDAAGDTYTVSTLCRSRASPMPRSPSMLTVVEAALKEMTTAATNLGAAKSRIDLQKTFTTSLMDSIERGVGQLVDADMNKESTRLQALQVQQQLGIQALSIANGNSQSSCRSSAKATSRTRRSSRLRIRRAAPKARPFSSFAHKKMRILPSLRARSALILALTISPVVMVNQELMAV